MKFNIAGVIVDLDVDDSLGQKIQREIEATKAKAVHRTKLTEMKVTSLKAENRVVEIDKTVCPHCGGSFIGIRVHEPIILGFCDRCRDNLISDKGNIYGMFSGSIGYRRVVPTFIPAEPILKENVPSQPAARNVSLSELLGDQK